MTHWLRRQFEAEVIRRRTHRSAVVACVLFSVVVSLALLRPGIYTVGPLVIGLESLRNPLLELGAAVLVALATRRRSFHLSLGPGLEPPLRLRRLWLGWTPGSRVFAIVLTAKLLITSLNLLRLPGQYFPSLRDSGNGIDDPLEEVFARGSRYEQFERFFERCRQELPNDARVLYSGRSEGQLLAYIIYPRPVFMHPTDRYVAWIGHQVLDLGRPLPDDELFPGGLPPPEEVPSLESFVAARRITHEVRFVESDLAECRIGTIR